MRIAFLSDPLDRQKGGIHVFIRELLSALSHLNTENEYIVIRSEDKKEFKTITEAYVPYYSFPGYRFWRLFYQLPRLLRKMDVDIVVEPAHFGPFNLPNNIKRITVIHDMTVFLYPEHHVFLSQYLQRKFLPSILRKADHVITNSNSTSKDVIDYFPFTKNKITSILLGKDETFQPSLDSNILKKYGISDSYMLYVGTLEPRKNIARMIEAFDIFKRKTGSSVKLVLIGQKGWKSNPIFEVLGNSNFRADILCLGYVKKEELPVFYSMAEVFIYPSIYEGFGLPILEAMACGVPVITSRVSSLPEVGGEAVLYVDPNSVNEIVDHMITICTKPGIRKKYIELGLSQANKFSWTDTAVQYAKLFETINNQ